MKCMRGSGYLKTKTPILRNAQLLCRQGPCLCKWVRASLSVQSHTRIAISVSAAMTFTSSCILYIPLWSLITAQVRSCWQPPVCALSQGWFWGFSILCCLSARHCDIPSVIWSLIISSARRDGICLRSHAIIICSARRDGICLRSHVLRMVRDAVDNNGLWADHLCYCSFLELGHASIMRRFDPYRVAQMVPVLCRGWWREHWVDIPNPNLISVNPIDRCSQRWCIILRHEFVSVHHFLNRAPAIYLIPHSLQFLMLFYILTIH